MPINGGCVRENSNRERKRKNTKNTNFFMSLINQSQLRIFSCELQVCSVYHHFHSIKIKQNNEKKGTTKIISISKAYVPIRISFVYKPVLKYTHKHVTLVNPLFFMWLTCEKHRLDPVIYSKAQKHFHFTFFCCQMFYWVCIKQEQTSLTFVCM